MAFGLYSLLEASLLVLNAICVLHEERFLAKFGWSVQHNRNSLSRTVMRIPLIFINGLVITKKLLLG
ncbi:immediate early response 3-interacting protein 1-like [Eurytemora carolleeae]|uniref:immediate early response 3-interacting protein 1-like n=1 Tax=Eurytemora carolleeae TaxID=1294199 RepID=UPI000C75B9A5|nr:immediate early response 3-interacting protein 1-like [Eurytemora carolleeae]|eukprot:XP_023340000.1 immediate early response 3-interacting protein 1-like [Eurytemora affinis]